MNDRRKRPHLIIINPDQWRGDVLGHVGNPAAQTPNLDRAAAAEFVSFRRAYCQNPVCTPSRCSFMSGWYPHTRGHRTMHHMLHPERGEPVLLKDLKDHGYFVWWGGKNDLVPAQNGFDAYCHVRNETTTNVPGAHDRAFYPRRGAPDGNEYYSFYLGEYPQPENGEPFQDTDWGHVRDAESFIRAYDFADPEAKPLCLFLALRMPHPPYLCEKPYLGMTDRERLPPRIAVSGNDPGKPRIIRELQAHMRLGDWTEAQWNELRGVYYDMCARVDAQFGLIMQALREAGAYDDSAVFFFSDHGDFTGDYNLVEKTQNTFEECLTRVPFLFKPPKDVPCKPRVSSAMIELVDFCATARGLADLPETYTAFGRSLLPIAAGDESAGRDAVFCEGGRLAGEMHASEQESNPDLNPEDWYYPRLAIQRDDIAHGKAVMCRTDRFKYVHRLYEPDELYDLEADPGETRNVAADPRYRDDLERHRARMLHHLLETTDVVPKEADQRGL